MPHLRLSRYFGNVFAMIPIDDTQLEVLPAPARRHTDIFFDALSYSAFPHVVSLEGKELLLAFRQAPCQAVIRHTHPRSVITVMRSYVLGESWDIANATQLGAGGGQEFGMLYLGNGVVGGALAKHGVAPMAESKRAGVPTHPHEYPFGLNGGYWALSRNYGFTWQIEDFRVVDLAAMPCSAPIRLHDGTLLLAAYGIAGGATVQSSLLYRSTDGGNTWSPPTLIAAGLAAERIYCEPGIVELAPGHLLCLHRTENHKVGPGGTFWSNTSYDGGRTWDAPQDTGILSGACPRLLKVADGRVLLTFGRRREPFGIRAILTRDGGKTWGDTAWVLRELPNWNQGYSSSVQLDDGRIFTVSYGENEAGVTGIIGTWWCLP